MGQLIVDYYNLISPKTQQHITSVDSAQKFFFALTHAAYKHKAFLVSSLMDMKSRNATCRSNAMNFMIKSVFVARPSGGWLVFGVIFTDSELSKSLLSAVRSGRI